MRKIAAALCLAALGLSAPTSAQYGGYGYGESRRGGYDGYGERRRGDEGYEERRGGGYGRARGSFWASCRDVDQDGPFLSATCRTRDGDWTPSRIDLRRCDGDPVSNQNGRLRC